MRQARDDVRREAWDKNVRLQVIDGPPGTGKTFVQHQLVRRTLAAGGKVLYVHVTANAASRAKEVFGDAVDVDTFHAALGDGSDGFANDQVLAFYALVLVDECFQMSTYLYQHLINLH